MSSPELHPTMMVVYDFYRMPERSSMLAWPPHVTIIPWFLVDSARWDAALDLVSDVAHDFAPIKVGIGGVAMYGGRLPRPATEIDDRTGRLHALRTALAWRLDESGYQFKGPVHAPEEYSPHTTHKPGIDPPDEDFTIDRISIITRRPRKVLDKYVLRVCALTGTTPEVSEY